MSIETWREQYAHLLEEVPLKHYYRDEAQPKDYKGLAGLFDQDELGGKHGRKAFFSRPQIRKNGAPKTVSRTVPGWFFNDTAIHRLLLIQFPKMVELKTQRHIRSSKNCRCAGCRDLRGALLWNYIIRRLRRNESAEEIARGWAPAKPKKATVSNKVTRPNVHNTDVRYWEKVLASHEEPATSHDSDDAVVFQAGELEPLPFECPNGRPITAQDVRRALQQMRFVADGLRTDGRPRRSCHNADVIETEGLSS